MMRLNLIGAAVLAVAAIGLSGCQAVQGLTQFNAALAPNLKPLSVSVEQSMKCADLADRMASVDSTAQTAAQVRTLVRACEEMQGNYALQLDPQAARKAVQAVIAKASVKPGAAIVSAVVPGAAGP